LDVESQREETFFLAPQSYRKGSEPLKIPLGSLVERVRH
jgi:hypothetical protein